MTDPAPFPSTLYTMPTLPGPSSAPPPAPPSVLVFGDCAWDLVTFADGTSERRQGGSAANTAAWLGTTGRVSVIFTSACAATDRRAFLSEMARTGVARTIMQESASPSLSVHVHVGEDGERVMFPAHPDAARPDPDMVQIPAGTLWVYLNGYSVASHPAASTRLIAKAHAAGARVAVSAGEVVVTDPAVDLIRRTAGADLLLCNDAEARALGPDGGACVEEIGRYLRATGGFPGVVITRGAEGAVCVTADGTVHPIDGGPPTPVVDTTGAGDAFAAGVLAGMAEGLTLPAACLRGVDLGRHCVAQQGSRPA